MPDRALLAEHHQVLVVRGQQRLAAEPGGWGRRRRCRPTATTGRTCRGTRRSPSGPRRSPGGRPRWRRRRATARTGPCTDRSGALPEDPMLVTRSVYVARRRCRRSRPQHDEWRPRGPPCRTSTAATRQLPDDEQDERRRARWRSTRRGSAMSASGSSQRDRERRAARSGAGPRIAKASASVTTRPYPISAPSASTCSAPNVPTARTYCAGVRGAGAGQVLVDADGALDDGDGDDARRPPAACRAGPAATSRPPPAPARTVRCTGRSRARSRPRRWRVDGGEGEGDAGRRRNGSQPRRPTDRSPASSRTASDGDHAAGGQVGDGDAPGRRAS